MQEENQPKPPKPEDVNAPNDTKTLQEILKKLRQMESILYNHEAPWEDRLRKVFSWIGASILTTFFAFVIGLVIYRDLADQAWYEIAKEHFAAVIGLPTAALAAAALVRIFKISEAKVTLKALGIELDTTSSSVILWVIVFLSIAAAVKLLW